jgi:hypothetical protein
MVKIESYVLDDFLKLITKGRGVFVIYPNSFVETENKNLIIAGKTVLSYFIPHKKRTTDSTFGEILGDLVLITPPNIKVENKWYKDVVLNKKFKDICYISWWVNGKLCGSNR